jgi:hypothetical protein
MKLTLAAFAALAVLATALPGTASAADCNGNLVDSYGATWTLHPAGYILDGAFVDGAGLNRVDAFDNWPGLSVSADGGTFFPYSNPNPTGCALEAGGRQFAFPADTQTLPGLAISRKIYVPRAGLAFARFLDIVQNTSTTPMTIGVEIGAQPDGLTSLGSDEDTLISATSNGDTTMDTRDNWATTWDGTPGGDPSLAHNWQDGGPSFAPHADFVGADSPDRLDWRFTNVTLGVGQTVIFMTTEAMRSTNAEAVTAAQSIDADPAELYTGMSAVEIAELQNWCHGDCDRDGVDAAHDNCPSVYNPDQADTDGDGQGDACDADIDGDGVSNVVETANGTDPKRADTDGDGFPDGVDHCPATPAASNGGCPVPSPPGSHPDTTPPHIALKLPAKTSVARLRHGVTFTVTSDEPASLAVQVVGVANRATLARVGDLVIASKSLPLGTGARQVTVAIAQAWRRAIARKPALRLQLVATDRSGNRTTLSRRLRITK